MVLRVARKHGIGALDQGRTRRFFLAAQVAQQRAGRQVHLDQLVAQVGVVSVVHVVLDDRGLGTLAQLDQMAQVAGDIGLRRGSDEHDVQRRGQAHVFAQAQDHAVGGQGGVEPGEHFIAMAVAAAHEVGGARIAVGQDLGQALQARAGGQAGRVRMRVVEAAVDEHQPRCGDAFEDRGVERARGLRRHGREAAPVERAQRGVLPGFATDQQIGRAHV